MVSENEGYSTLPLMAELHNLAKNNINIILKWDKTIPILKKSIRYPRAFSITHVFFIFRNDLFSELFCWPGFYEQSIFLEICNRARIDWCEEKTLSFSFSASCCVRYLLIYHASTSCSDDPDYLIDCEAEEPSETILLFFGKFRVTNEIRHKAVSGRCVVPGSIYSSNFTKV